MLYDNSFNTRTCSEKMPLPLFLTHDWIRLLETHAEDREHAGHSSVFPSNRHVSVAFSVPEARRVRVVAGISFL